MEECTSKTVEIDSDFEFDAPRYFDFIHGSQHDIDSWFDSALGYPPSSFITMVTPKKHTSKAASSESDSVEELKMPTADSDATYQETELFAEVDPSGRYGRYAELLGHGAVKMVYKAFDFQEGREVAWNQIKLSKFSNNSFMVDKIHSEIALLKELKNENIIVMYHFWKDSEKNILNFITEACCSGNLRGYRKKHPHVSIKALKRWSRQILLGLDYLHTHDPCVIHRDLNCSNVFINGNMGKVKIGDFGLATIVGKSHAAHSLLGTPEYMAPELYEENYTELVDIYSFAMCLIEMATLEIPYSECDSIAKLYKTVTSGRKPQAFNRVTDPELKAFIEKCVGQPRRRPSAAELLKDQFLSDVNFDEDDS